MLNTFLSPCHDGLACLRLPALAVHPIKGIRITGVLIVNRIESFGTFQEGTARRAPTIRFGASSCRRGTACRAQEDLIAAPVLNTAS